MQAQWFVSVEQGVVTVLILYPVAQVPEDIVKAARAAAEAALDEDMED